MADQPTFDPEDDATWPCPNYGRRDDLERAWLEGFEKALMMSDRFHMTGEWATDD